MQTISNVHLQKKDYSSFRRERGRGGGIFGLFNRKKEEKIVTLQGESKNKLRMSHIPKTLLRFIRDFRGVQHFLIGGFHKKIHKNFNT